MNFETACEGRLMAAQRHGDRQLSQSRPLLRGYKKESASITPALIAFVDPRTRRVALSRWQRCGATQAGPKAQFVPSGEPLLHIDR